MLKTRYLAGLKSLNLCPSELKLFLLLSSMGLAVPLSSSPFFYYLAWAWLTDVPMPPSVVLCVWLRRGGKICNLCKLELT